MLLLQYRHLGHKYDIYPFAEDATTLEQEILWPFSAGQSICLGIKQGSGKMYWSSGPDP